MYSHEHQQPHQPFHPPTIMHQLVDNVSVPLYQQQQISSVIGYPPSSNTYKSPLSSLPALSNTMAHNHGNGGYAHHPSQLHLPAEPIPSTTNAPTPPMTIPQLAEFAATMTYFLWHVRKASVMALHSASAASTTTTTTTCNNLTVNQGGTTSSTLQQSSNPAFQRFCQQILTTTQVSESVVLLALKYIAKLLQASPGIQGAEGSEYRLFIVALLLANKFHDDNTFTNKTWSDISGMKLRELDIMELEFLNVLDFRLFVGKEEFDHWKTGLFTFMLQVQNATVMQEQQQQQQMMDATLRSMGLFLPPDAATATSAPPPSQQQQQQQYPYLFSTIAQPELLQIQPRNTPVTRVPLRIPSYPVYMPSTSSSSSSVHSTPTSNPAASHVPTTTSYVPPATTPINNALYHPPPPQVYQQQQQQQQLTNSNPASYASTPTANQLLPPPPQPYVNPTSSSSSSSSSRPLPRNASTPSLSAWSRRTRSTTPVEQTQHYHHNHHPTHHHHTHHQRAYRPYQRPPTNHTMDHYHHQQHQQSLVDYYAWKSLTEGPTLDLTSPMDGDTNNHRFQHPPQQQRYTRRRSYSNPFPLYHQHRQQQQQQQMEQQQQMLKPYPRQQQQQHQLSPHDSNQYQDYQQTGADPSQRQHDQQQHQQQQYHLNASSGLHHSN